MVPGQLGSLLVTSLAGLVAGQNVQQQSQKRFLLDNPYNLCRQPLFIRSNVTASSSWEDR